MSGELTFVGEQLWRRIGESMDRVHLLDMIEVGLIDASWADRFPSPLSDRLRSLIENPDQ